LELAGLSPNRRRRQNLQLASRRRPGPGPPPSDRCASQRAHQQNLHSASTPNKYGKPLLRRGGGRNKLTNSRRRCAGCGSGHAHSSATPRRECSSIECTVVFAVYMTPSSRMGGQTRLRYWAAPHEVVRGVESIGQFTLPRCWRWLLAIVAGI
jgi:hypothetical protein